MKYLPRLLILVLAATTLASCQDTSPPKLMPPGTFNHYYAPAGLKRVTIETANGPAAVLDVPEGAFLNVQAREDQNPAYRESTTPPREFRGELVIRIRRADEMEAGESGAAAAMMAKASLELHLVNAVVKVEKL